MKSLTFAILISLSAGPVFAGPADVVAVRYDQGSDGTYSFHVTVRHDDAGWDHYADRWQVLGPDGTVLGERVLAHPHDNEQPFTRSQSGIVIPDEVDEVTVRAHDTVHGWSGQEATVAMKGRF
ncbi:hypothetical protein CSC94_21145 [Zhengella mangrovi]|uniref:Uncharacterized protein n=1 Tax=Zhengella mangrovi TaxID=1982044 RepID=A0A2G1QHT3_9HYPH|nr:hypothetical protein [Zhengella mangrovi]PHP65039.1 hypothetical protein CSC94_21145 [Zhengella mangrovi]